MRDGWKKVAISDVCIMIKRGQAPSYTENKSVTVLNQKCIRDGRINLEFSRQTDANLKPINEWAYLNATDTLVNSTGVGTLGRVAFVRNLPEPTTVDSHVTIVRPDNKKVEPSFLGLSLNFREADIEGLAAGSSGQTELSREALGNLIITLPTLPEQKRIVDLISSVDSYVEALQQQLESAKRSRNAVLHELLTAGGDDWVETSLGEIADWGSGGTPKADNAEYYGGTIPWCVIGDLTEGEVWETEKTISQLGLTNSSAKIIDPESVLLAMYGASIGRTGISAIPMATNQAIAFAKCKEEYVLPWYLLVYLQTQKSKFIEMGQGAAQPNISQTIIKSWPITLPPIGHQKKVIDRIESFSKLIEGTDLLVDETKKLKSSLLSDLLSGEHEIPTSYDKVMGAA